MSRKDFRRFAEGFVIGMLVVLVGCVVVGAVLGALLGAIVLSLWLNSIAEILPVVFWIGFFAVGLGTWNGINTVLDARRRDRKGPW